jgi:very-short-patch-repair endonuclease
MGKKSTKEDFIKKAIEIHGDKYDYSGVEYIGNKLKVNIICLLHGEFYQRPNDHLSGYGCKKCQYKKTSSENKFTNELFIKRANLIHSSKYDYSFVRYDGYENKIKIVCLKHGEFMQSPHSHLSGAGCPSCKESRGENKVTEILMKNNIKFQKQVTFNNLRDVSNLYYDFYLPDHKIFIEYEGKQHYSPIPFFGGKEAFLKTRKHDIIKYKYAVNNGYKILKIMCVPVNQLEEQLYYKLKEISVL